MVFPGIPSSQATCVLISPETTSAKTNPQWQLPMRAAFLMNGSPYSRLDGYRQSLWRWTGATFEKASIDEEANLLALTHRSISTSEWLVQAIRPFPSGRSHRGLDPS